MNALLDYVVIGQWFNTGGAGVELEHLRCGETVLDGAQFDDRLTVHQILLAIREHHDVCPGVSSPANQ